MRYSAVCAVLAAFFLGSPALAKGDYPVPVTETFAEGKINVNGYGIGYVYRWAVFNSNGQIAVCGAGYFADASSAIAMRRLLRKAVVEVNGRPVLRDLSFFTKVRSEKALPTAQATCKLTGVPVPNVDDLSIEIVFPSGFIRF